MSNEIKLTGLALLRAPFESHQISKLPKPTKHQTEEVKNDFNKGFRCPECNGWHHPKVVHLDYVGHAALTDRLLNCDENWNWEPLSLEADNSPKFDKNGGLWIKLTVCGVTRIGYGHPDGKTGGDAIKETIGDALRNAAMRFGAALDLWHKGDLHKTEEDDKKADANPTAPKSKPVPQEFTGDLKEFVMTCGNKNVKGKKLSEIDQKDLLDCIDFFTDKRKKEPTGTVAVPIKNAIKFLSDSIPF